MSVPLWRGGGGKDALVQGNVTYFSTYPTKYVEQNSAEHTGICSSPE